MFISSIFDCWITQNIKKEYRLYELIYVEYLTFRNIIKKWLFNLNPKFVMLNLGNSA